MKELEKKLWNACSQGNAALVDKILSDEEGHVDVNFSDEAGDTPLIRCCRLGKVTCVQSLLRNQRIDVNKKDGGEGSSPLLLASQLGHSAIVKLLLSHPRIDVNLPNEYSRNAFYSACRNGHVEACELLLADPRIDVNKVAKDNFTPLIVASQGGHVPVVQRILASGREVDVKKKTAAGKAAWNGKSAAEIGRMQATRPRYSDETEEEYKNSGKFGSVIADLIDSYEKDPHKVAAQLREYIAKTSPPPAVQTPSPAPVPAAVSVPPAAAPAQVQSRSASQDAKKIAVEFNGDVHALRVPLTSMEDLVNSLRDQLTISSGVSLSYYDPEVELFVVLKNLEDLPAEKAKIRVVAQSLSWWGWSPDATWAEKGYETTRYYSLLVKEGSKIHNSGALEKFRLAAEPLGFNPDQIHKIYAISNPKLLVNFDNYRDSLQAKHRANPGLFKKDDWKTLPEAEKRQHHLDLLFAEIGKWKWNEGSNKPAVLPMVQGTTEAAAWQICQQGFGVVATTDDGFYGRGVYFTSKFKYATLYAKDSDDGKVFLLSAVTPGNVFPITEHPFLPDGTVNPEGFMGKACRAGYQSHQALVDERNPSVVVPKDQQLFKLADELVTFEAAQAVPTFVFYVK